MEPSHRLIHAAFPFKSQVYSEEIRQFRCVSLWKQCSLGFPPFTAPPLFFLLLKTRAAALYRATVPTRVPSTVLVFRAPSELSWESRETIPRDSSRASQTGLLSFSLMHSQCHDCGARTVPSDVSELVVPLRGVVSVVKGVERMVRFSKVASVLSL